MKRFKSPATFAKWIRSRKKGENIGDFVKVSGHTFTMDYYDMAGKECNYGNRKSNLNLAVFTTDRYGKGWADATVVLDEAAYYRTDIHYLE